MTPQVPRSHEMAVSVLVDGEALCDLLKELSVGVRTEQVEQVTVEPAFFQAL